MINFTEEEILSRLKDEQKTEEFLSTLAGEDIKELLLYVNSKVRNIPIEENRFCEETMCAGGLVSPDNEIQSRYFEKIADALKNVKGKKDRATMMFYLINELHLFEDGNGRTSRAIFEMLSNKDFSFENNDTLIHDDENDYTKVDHNEFQKNNSIEGSYRAEQCSNCFLYKALVQSGIIPNTDFYKKKIIIMTDADELLEHNLNEDTNKDNNPVFVPEDVKNQLSYIQYNQIQNSLADNNGSLITTSGMTLLLIAIKNGKIGELSNYEFAEGEAISLPADRESGTGEEHLSEFEKEDYLKTIDVANILKEGMLDMIVDFFEHPNNFSINETTTMKDVLTNGSIDITTIDLLELKKEPDLLENYEISRAINQNGTINITGTRTEKTMQVLSQYMEQNRSRNNSINEISDIGKQVIAEISDPIIEDETEKQVQRDLENMQNRGTKEK